MPDATGIPKGFQNMTLLECPICPKKVPDDFVFFNDGMCFSIYNRDGLKTKMPDATETLKGFQNMTHLECPIYARKQVPDPIFLVLDFLMMEAFQVRPKNFFCRHS